MTSPADVLRACFDHHVWATLTLIGALEALPPGRLAPGRLDDQIPGTYGSTTRTLAHLVAADDRYLRRLAGERLGPATDDGEAPPLTKLRAEFGRHTDRWLGFLDRLDAGTLDVTLTGRTHYPDTPHAEGMFMLQALHHGNDHRTQICSTLGALGFAVPDLDGWAYWAEGR